MTFTYFLDTDIGTMRFELGDTVPDSGVKADGSNFTDEELQYLLTRENNLDLAIASACETLSRDWSKIASITLGQKQETLGKVAQEWSTRANEIRLRVGGTYASYSFTPHRIDGYTDKSSEGSL